MIIFITFFVSTFTEKDQSPVAGLKVRSGAKI